MAGAKTAGSAIGPRPPGASDCAGVDASWLADLRAYEHARRREVDVALQRGPTVRLDCGAVQRAERAFDPLLQRFREDTQEQQQRQFEDSERTKYLNRAADVQLKREHPFNIMTHEGRLDLLQPTRDGGGAGGGAGGGGGDASAVPEAEGTGRHPMPTTMCDHNIVSNLPVNVHHWGNPHERPLVNQKLPKQRNVPVVNIKDFNVITNRYLVDHEAKAHKEDTLNLLEATAKFRKQNHFDPLAQTFADARHEGRMRAYEDAQRVKDTMQQQLTQPASYRAKASAAYDVVTHAVKDEHHLRWLERLEAERKARYSVRHQAERCAKEQDTVFQDALAEQRHSQIAHERFVEVTSRGHDIITNKPYGDGPKYQRLYPPKTKPKPTAWDNLVREGFVAATATPPAAAPAALPAAAALGADGRGRGQAEAPGAPAATPRPPRAATPRLAELGARALGSSCALAPGGQRSARSARSGFLAAAAAPAAPGTPAAPAPAPAPARAPPVPAVPGSPAGGGSAYSQQRRR